MSWLVEFYNTLKGITSRECIASWIRKILNQDILKFNRCARIHIINKVIECSPVSISMGAWKIILNTIVYDFSHNIATFRIFSTIANSTNNRITCSTWIRHINKIKTSSNSLWVVSISKSFNNISNNNRLSLLWDMSYKSVDIFTR